jgi:hypothetical protein
VSSAKPRRTTDQCHPFSKMLTPHCFERIAVWQVRVRALISTPCSYRQLSLHGTFPLARYGKAPGLRKGRLSVNCDDSVVLKTRAVVVAEPRLL